MAQSLIVFLKQQFLKQQRSKQLRLGLMVGVISLFCVGTSFAQDLPDPTKPPRLVSGGEDGLPIGPVLQSVLIGANRKLAIIDGQTVKLNGKFGQQTLIRLTETEAVLKQGKELQTLKLFPDFHKEPVRETLVLDLKKTSKKMQKANSRTNVKTNGTKSINK
jgi:MSHA biogenesis protein MshK